ncbi:MAG: 2-oxoacid:ferredoxin oxidoreductase subunit beta [Anaerolineae bacterium]|nr:2-oxoacid:ferredoxin oxidoreductase subunit beta [Anaerolineae bacterium]MDQ7034820.1 2-oxoacid:ferredoxin oxidoreductase subunit beta [Anaerolineae bacterium]
MARVEKTNKLGLVKDDYQARPTTLCPGCGHNSISNQIVQSAFDLNIAQHQLLKMSGIGCSSKSPAYFLGRSHGFNALHGRMPSVVTGALMANHTLKAIAVSGDGDTGSIGMGQFKHVIRRNVPFVYIIENNGVYGLTKGQFSATAEEGLELKHYGRNEMPPIDLVLEAIISGATFVARSFSGDKKQVQALLEAAIAHKGTAILDIISPCVTFNNADTSHHSFPYGVKHEVPLHEIQIIAPDFVAPQDEIEVETYEDGQTIEVSMHDGTSVLLKKLDKDYDPRSKAQAYAVLEEAQREELFLTGLIYYEEPRPTLPELEQVADTPLALINDRPSKDKLDDIMKSFK